MHYMCMASNSVCFQPSIQPVACAKLMLLCAGIEEDWSGEWCLLPVCACAIITVSGLDVILVSFHHVLQFCFSQIMTSFAGPSVAYRGFCCCA